ncbi:hypothetical protein AN964_12300 [Heyndrickxia shackletonii]|uniref:Uncharacterized protein n=1 Tax=Heyndrickxia shackletonii TaxID=157838 RepID=A0A0Q3TJP2_9BACI|nr:hypothetical protein [Heyndrickxia shackletonii]KQL54198.1 hypothetical protein AN964_12300 [Heyndrickxia shackletonii]NEZ02219.1 hypothetical protein [Heyndrickxia shackletonii]
MNEEKTIVDLQVKKDIEDEINALKFTKNFRSATAEEWYIFMKNYADPETGGAAGKAIIHYNLYGNKEIFINTTIIFDDERLFNQELYSLVYAIADETVNRLIGYADTLLSVHAGSNSYHAEYKSN